MSSRRVNDSMTEGFWMQTGFSMTPICRANNRPGGRWNVLQNIDRPRRCAHYLRAPESLIKQRTTYLARLTNPGGESIQDRAQRLWHR